MNKGVKKAKGEWLYFLGADDQLYNNNILEQVFKDDLQDYQIIFGNIMYSTEVIFTSIFSKKLWYKNTLHHQSAFYKRALFYTRRFDEKLKILADYQMNLALFKEGVTTKSLNLIIAYCRENGVSKSYKWNLYREEIQIKKSLSPPFIWPFFYFLGLLKFLFRMIMLKNKPTSK